MKSHFDAIDEILYGMGLYVTPLSVRRIVRELNDSGYIIVRKGAIGQAQREAVAQYKEDNDNYPPGMHKVA